MIMDDMEETSILIGNHKLPLTDIETRVTEYIHSIKVNMSAGHGDEKALMESARDAFGALINSQDRFDFVISNRHAVVESSGVVSEYIESFGIFGLVISVAIGKTTEPVVNTPQSSSANCQK